MDATELHRELREATELDDAESFSLTLSQRLGIERNDLLGSAESILHAKWKDCPRSIAALPSNNVCAVGIDCGGLDDPASVALLWKVGNVHHLRVWQYLTQSGYDRAGDNLKEIYDAAIKAGTLSVHADVDALDTAIHALCAQLYNSNRAQTVLGGDEHGRSGFKAAFTEAVGSFTSVPQTWQLGAALNTMESLVDAGRLLHSHCPLMAANVRNLLIEHLPSGNLKLKKRDDLASGGGSAKIDGIIGAPNAQYLLNNNAPREFNPARFIA
jgi:phage terminase large subunit-like protein